MKKGNKIIIISLFLILLVGFAYFSTIGGESLSVIGITETIVCKPNDNNCGLSAKDTNTWQMTANVMSSSTSVKLVVPSGTEMVLGDSSKIKTTSDISLTFTNGQPYQTVGLSNAGYETYIYDFWLPLGKKISYPESYKTQSAASRIITSTYDVTLSNQFGTKTVSNSFNYGSNKVITISDSSGKTAYITNQFQTYSGVSTEVGDMAIVGGYGDLRSYYRTDFETKNAAYNRCSNLIMSPTDPICRSGFYFQNDYTSVLNYLETSRFGLVRQYLSTQGFSVSNQVMKINYPPQGIGTYVLVEFPKSMVSYIVIQDIGSKASGLQLSKYPEHIGFGEGSINIKATSRNDGTTDMMYGSATSSNGRWIVTTLSSSGQYVGAGQTGTWNFEARLANSLGMSVTDDICVTIKGTLRTDSGITECISVTGDPTVVSPDTYRVWVKAYKPDMTNLATAIIKQNGNVIGYGSVETTLTNGKQYRFTSENTSGFYPPIVDITVSGQPSEIKLVFSNKNDGDGCAPDDYVCQFGKFGFLGWIASFFGLTAIIAFFNKYNRRESYLTDKNLKTSASMSVGILALVWLYMQYTIVSNALGVWLWVAVALSIFLCIFLVTSIPMLLMNKSLVIAIWVVLFILIVNILMGMKGAICSTPLSFMISGCESKDFWQIIMGK